MGAEERGRWGAGEAGGAGGAGEAGEAGGDISCSVISAFLQEEQGRDAICYPDTTLLGGGE
ncbi:MAG: hypothetical protein RIB93_13920 [Coleofasciculus sp. D1-CHI-01]|uniref:hypothetical protein n=1 Tax=Coleofasciculus sp. D1-CHI-01 TaxID=3068482 RepID=UPI0032FB9793